MDEQPTSAASEPANGTTDSLLTRLRARAEQLSQGRRLTLPLPGWDDLGDGRGLWARFQPFSREMQQRFGTSPSATEVDVMAELLTAACEEILIGTREQRRPLSDELLQEDEEDVPFGPLRFGLELGAFLGTGGSDGPSCIKRMLITSGDDLRFFAVASEVLRWSDTLHFDGVETAAGE